MHICAIQRNGTYEPICKAEIERDGEQSYWHQLRGKGGWDELGGWDWYIYTTMYKIEN